jgi:soluble lytic murein transglycosylase-like protein
MPQTVKRFGVKNVFDVAQNVDAGARYLRWLLDRFDGRVDLALAGYNAGEGAVTRHRGIPPFAETEWYVIKVLDRASRSGQPPSP